MRIVLTGGPGAGKTSVIEELERIGHKIVAEPARTLIEHYKIHSPELLPALSRENRKLFQIAIENTTVQKGIVPQVDYPKFGHVGFRACSPNEEAVIYDLKIEKL